MEYLKREILYPLEGEEDINLIRKANSDYEAYLDSVKDKLPKKLIKAYNEEERFHDRIITELQILGDAYCYNKKSDRVIIKLYFNRVELEMEFYEISLLKLDIGSNKSCWITFRTTKSNAQQTYDSFLGLHEINSCELGLIKDNLYKFEFFTDSGASVEIHFSKIKIFKKIRTY